MDVLYGDVSPSGKLPYTIAKEEGDYGTAVSGSGVDKFEEGLFVDYRHFDQAGIEPRFEFGFGLCEFSWSFFCCEGREGRFTDFWLAAYTNFTYSDLVVSAAAAGNATASEDLFAEVATVTATIANAGSVAGAEVAQLYVSLPTTAGVESPPKQLRGFEKLSLGVGESGSAEFVLRRRDLSYWSVEEQRWVLPAGEFGVAVAASSRDVRLEGVLEV